jgi:ketosteroid isomerase-like protein
MTITIPIQAALYLDAVDRHDLEASLAAFAPDAVVVDEGRSHRGDEIREWRATAASGYTYTSEFRGLEPTDETHSVARYHLEGDFPGGVVDLRFAFTLRAGDGLIERLEIAL